MESEALKEQRLLREDKIGFYRNVSKGMRGKFQIDNQKDVEFMLASIMLDLLDEMKSLKAEFADLKEELKKKK